MKTDAVYHVFYDDTLGAVVMDWDGYATSEQFRKGTELMLETLIQNKTGKVLADIKDMILIGQEDQQWLEIYFLPQAIDAGLSAVAMIRPDSYFNNVAIETISGKIDKAKLALRFFGNKAEAVNWLKTI